MRTRRRNDEEHQLPVTGPERVARPGGVAGRLLHLQATAGNAAVTAMVQRQPRRIVYPNYRNVSLNKTVRPAMWEAWKETVNETTPTSRREQGFWIQWNVKSLNNANGRYRIRGAATSPAVPPTQDASFNAAPQPDNGDWHTVAHFHTHTPTRYRRTAADGTEFTSRPAGATPADDAGHTAANVTGIVRDYEGEGGAVPAGHPLWAPSRYYRAGPWRRV